MLPEMTKPATQGRPMPTLRRQTPRFAVLLSSLALAASAQAQSLAELVDAARGFDATYQAAKSQSDSVQYRKTQAEAGLKPQVGLSGELSHQVSNPQSNDFGTFDLTLAQAGVRATQPLYNRSRRLAVDQADRAYQVSLSDLALAEQDLTVRVAQAYFDVLSARDVLANARASKAYISEQLASAKRNFEVGTATITDTREAQARYDLAQAQEIAADNDLRTKRILLDQLVGRPGSDPKPIVPSAALPSPAPADAEQWVTRSDAEHPALRKARLGLELAKLNTEQQKASTAPTANLVGTAGVARTLGKAATAPGTTPSLKVGVEATWPLYTSGLTDAAVKEALALEERARQDQEAARRQIAQNTRSLFYGLQSGLARVKALEAAESSSKLALEATQLGYKVGVRVNLDVLNAQAQLNNTQTDLAKARYDVLVNTLRLRQAAGVLQAADVQLVNGLLAK
jgi:outer membrane protein